VLVLYGSGAECITALLKREHESGRGLDSDHWIQNNAATYARFSTPDYDSYRVTMFKDGVFRKRAALVRDVKSRLTIG
jgi:hypothetical protein